MLCCCGGFSAAVEMESLLGQQSAPVPLQLSMSCVIISNMTQTASIVRPHSSLGEA